MVIQVWEARLLSYFTYVTGISLLLQYDARLHLCGN